MAFFEFPHTRTYDSDLGWIISKINAIIAGEELNQTDIQELQNAVESLQLWQSNMESGNYSVAVANSIRNFILMQGLDLIGALATPVAFELTQSGYFVANYPETWNDVTFNTTEYDISVPDYDYGHLVLTY